MPNTFNIFFRDIFFELDENKDMLMIKNIY